MSGELIVDKIKPADELIIDGDLSVTGKVKGNSPGSIISVVHQQTNEFIRSNNIILWDDTRPQNSEGVKILQASIIPKNINNRLIIDAVVHAVEETNTADHIVVAVFKDDEADAIVCATQEVYGNYDAYGGLVATIPLKYQMTAGTTNSINFTLRAGVNGGYININGGQGIRKLGGSLYCTLTVTEVAV